MIDRVRGGAFNRLHNLSQRNDSVANLVDGGRKNQVNVIRHDDRDPKTVSLSMVVQAAGEHNVTSPFWKSLTVFGVKGDEMRREVPLDVRQIATIELHNKILSCPHR